jgi:hypothetical protein
VVSSIPFNANGLPTATMLCEHPTPRHDPAKIAVAMREADLRARRLRRKLRVKAEDEEDFRQALLLDLLSRSHGYDEHRSAWRTFTWTVMRNASARIAQQHLSANQANLPLAVAMHVPAVTTNADAVHVAVDFRRAARTLRPDLLRVAEGIARADSISDAQRASALSKATFYRALSDLRLNLLATGASLDALPQFARA